MTRYAPLLWTATACAAAALSSADARLVGDRENNNQQRGGRRRRMADQYQVQAHPTGAARDEFSRLDFQDENADLERPVPGTGGTGGPLEPLEERAGPASVAVAEAIAEAASPGAAEAELVAAASPEEEAAVCSPADDPGSCADLATLGTTLFRALVTPLLLSNGSSGEEMELENVLLSPLSIGQALALVSAGATPGSPCEAELFQVLGTRRHSGVPLLADAILSSATSSSSSSNTAAADDSGVHLASSSSLWLHGSIKASYEERAEVVHHATARPLPRTYGPMNEWAELVSNGEIKNLFDGSQVVDPLTRAALVNVVSFRGTWTRRFDPAKTEVGVFYKRKNGGGAGVQERQEEKVVQYMKDRRHVLLHPAREDLGGAAVMKLDYGPVRTDPERGWDLPSDFAALMVLPGDSTAESERAALEGLARSASVADLIRDLRPREVNLSLPKFKLEFGTASLSEALRSMGLHEVFDGTGVLSGMSDDPDLHLDDVLHKAVMEVTEEGTTASAATAAMIMTRSVPPPPMDLEFNRPFFVMVVHVKTGTPLFVGRVADPNLSFEEDGVERR